MSLVIEKGVPLPPRRERVGGLAATLRALAVGDSFVYQTNRGIGHVAKRAGIVVATRKVEGGYRIWRLA
jgi:hypothetical protein